MLMGSLTSIVLLAAILFGLGLTAPMPMKQIFALREEFEFLMKKTKKNKNLWLNQTEINVGYLYFTTANQYRAVLAMKGDFLIYAPSSEGMEPLVPNAKMPFDNSPWKKCQIATFAQKEYQAFDWQGTLAIKHKLTNTQLAEAITQCNAKASIEALMAS